MVYDPQFSLYLGEESTRRLDLMMLENFKCQTLPGLVNTPVNSTFLGSFHEVKARPLYERKQGQTNSEDSIDLKAKTLLASKNMGRTPQIGDPRDDVCYRLNRVTLLTFLLCWCVSLIHLVC